MLLDLLFSVAKGCLCWHSHLLLLFYLYFVASQAVAQRLLLLTSEVQTAKQRVGLEGDGAPSLGSLEYAVLRLEEYANDLETRVVLRFDGAASVGDIAGMQECALIMSELKREMTLAQVGRVSLRGLP